jgi:hypothetical protein
MFAMRHSTNKELEETYHSCLESRWLQVNIPTPSIFQQVLQTNTKSIREDSKRELEEELPGTRKGLSWTAKARQRYFGGENEPFIVIPKRKVPDHWAVSQVEAVGGRFFVLFLEQCPFDRPIMCGAKQPRASHLFGERWFVNAVVLCAVTVHWGGSFGIIKSFSMAYVMGGVVLNLFDLLRDSLEVSSAHMKFPFRLQQ